MTDEASSVSVFYDEVDFNLPDEQVVENWIQKVMREEGKRIKNINIVFCSDESLLDLNRSYLLHDYYTDVLTFPYQKDPIEGEIYISVDRISENAISHKKTLIEEALRVIIHGVLHLCGYDDSEEKSKAIMTGKEDHYLEKFPGRY